MSNREKLLSKIRSRPKSVRFEELAKLLEWYGFELRRVRGSHHSYCNGPYIILLSRHKSHVHSYAVKQALDAIDELLEEKE